MNQWKSVLLGLWVLPLHAGLSSEWSYSRATSAAQKGDWKNTQECIRSLLVDEPDRPDLLYDAGVTAYKLKEFEKANAYFSAVTEQESAEKELKKQAHFNGGNTKVALHKLEDALAAYEQALAIDSDDQKARHNRDKVKEMLEQQKQQQQNKQSQKDKDKKQEDTKSAEDKQQHNSQQGDESNEKKDSQDQQKNNDSGSQQKQEQEKKQEDSPEADQQKQQRSDDKQDGQHENETGNETNNKQADDKKDQFSDEHASSSQDTTQKHKRDESQDIKRDDKEQEMQVGNEDPGDYRQEELSEIEKKLPQHEKWMARALQQLEKAEEKEQKKLIRAQTRKQVVGNNEQNCW